MKIQEELGCRIEPYGEYSQWTILNNYYQLEVMSLDGPLTAFTSHPSSSETVDSHSPSSPNGFLSQWVQSFSHKCSKPARLSFYTLEVVQVIIITPGITINRCQKRAQVEQETTVIFCNRRIGTSCTEELYLQ